MTAPALQLRLGRPHGAPPPPPGPTWVPAAAGTGLTLLLVLLLAVGLAPGARWLIPGAGDPTAPPPERLTWVDVPPAPLPPAAEPTSDARTAPLVGQPSGMIAPATPARPTLPRSAPRTAAPPTLPVDSAAEAVGAGRLPPRAPAARLPDGITFPPPARAGAPAPACDAPCLGGNSGAVSTRAAPLTRAERDSVLRAVGRSVPALAREMRRRGEGAPSSAPADPGAIPKIQGGVSLDVGLPGGGPTRAQRERDRRIHAENTAALARIRAREDSIARADSIRRARAARPPG